MTYQSINVVNKRSHIINALSIADIFIFDSVKIAPKVARYEISKITLHKIIQVYNLARKNLEFKNLRNSWVFPLEIKQ